MNSALLLLTAQYLKFIGEEHLPVLEVLFCESAAASMSVAIGKKSCACKADDVIFGRSDSHKPFKAEIRRLQPEVEDRERQSLSQTVPLEGSRRDIILLPLALSVGAIDENGIGLKRELALSMLMEIHPSMCDDVVAQSLKISRESLTALLERAENGEPIRVWSSDNPDESCGLYWLMEQLRPADFKNLDITLVKPPDFEEHLNGTAVQHNGWSEIEAHQWERMTTFGKKLPLNYVLSMADRWRQLRKENAPLRAVLNGRLASVPETLYDSFILRELDAQKTEFVEAMVVGAVLSKYQLGIGDAWVALRIEQFIRDGLLCPVSKSDRNDPIYHRMLRKHGQRNDKSAESSPPK